MTIKGRLTTLEKKAEKSDVTIRVLFQDEQDPELWLAEDGNTYRKPFPWGEPDLTIKVGYDGDYIN